MYVFELRNKNCGFVGYLLCHLESMCGLQVLEIIVLPAHSGDDKNKSLHNIKRKIIIKSKWCDDFFRKGNIINIPASVKLTNMGFHLSHILQRFHKFKLSIYALHL
jgi:hypothetical protein